MMRSSLLRSILGTLGPLFLAVVVPAARAATIIGLCLSAIACGRAEPERAPSATGVANAGAPAAANADAAREDALIVFAAASLREVFTALGAEFERAHPGVSVTFNFAGTQELRTQIEHGAAADVLASADLRHMDALAQAGRVVGPRVFTKNRLVLIVARERKEAIRSIADVPGAGRVVIGGPEVPIGRYTLQALDRAGAILGADFRARVEAKVVSRELNVRQVLAKVRLGEADAGFVYRTDAWPVRAELGVVELPPEVDVLAEYPIAIAADAPHASLARSWVELVLGEVGQRALADAGFLPLEQGGSTR